jgi:poly(beta-D-mannuronate) lyase
LTVGLAALSGVGGVVLVALPGEASTAATGVGPAKVTTVGSLSALQSAAASAAPGDTIQLADGSYSGTVKLSKSGASGAPITVQAEHVGKATISGTGITWGSGLSYVTVSGFVFKGSSGMSVPVGATHNRISRNVFQLASSVGNWLTVGGDDTEVDHNTFQHKTTAGVFFQLSGPGSNGIAQRVRVDHNYFFDHQFKGDNGGESIRFGLSGRQHSSAHGIIEYNLFEHADGDSEAISVKSSDNIVRYNTLRNTRGTISLRHGWGTTVEGNYVLGGQSGIRFFGNNHTIINNVVQGSSGLELEVGGGEVRDDTTSGTDHEAADNCVVAFNTIVGSGGVVKFNNGKAYPPSHITFADNIVEGTSGSAVTGGGGSLSWQGNILHGGSAGIMPSSGYHSVDPKLATDAAGLYRIGSGSAAIGAATGSYPQVTLDMDGQARPSAKDTGADQYVAGGTDREPLTTAQVGPNAP